MGRGRNDRCRATFHEEFRTGANRSSRIDHVVDDYAMPTLDLTDDVFGLNLVLLALQSAFMNDRKIGRQLLRIPLRYLHPTGIWRDHNEILAVLLQVPDQNGHGGEVIHRTIEETLDLTGVQVNRHEPRGPGRFEEISDESSRDRFPSFTLAILTGVPVEREHRSDALG